MGMYLMGFMVVFSLALVTYALWPKRTDEGDTIKRRVMGRSKKATGPDPRGAARSSLARRMISKVAPLAVKPVMLNNPEKLSKLRMKLANAGLRGDHASTTFLASKTIVAVCLGLVGLTYALTFGESFQATAGLVLFGLAIGFMGPNVWLSMAVSKRKELIRNGLPDTLDLLVISVESGLGLDSALQRVADEMRPVHPALAEELQMVTLEAQMGIPRSEALSNFANRTDLEEVTSLTGVINQAERFGTSVARALRNQSNVLRTKRRMAAEERAQQTTVKLMAPLILFIFPAIIVVLGGPAALTMMEAMKNTSAFG